MKIEVTQDELTMLISAMLRAILDHEKDMICFERIEEYRKLYRHLMTIPLDKPIKGGLIIHPHEINDLEVLLNA